MIGMKSFYVRLPRMQFSTTIGSITYVVSNYSSMDQNISFMYFSFKLRVCPTGYPYFSTSTQLCYDICPNGMYGNITTLLCLDCHPSCSICNSNASCNCTVGYYLAANNSCQACSLANCL